MLYKLPSKGPQSANDGNMSRWFEGVFYAISRRGRHAAVMATPWLLREQPDRDMRLAESVEEQGMPADSR